MIAAVLTGYPQVMLAIGKSARPLAVQPRRARGLHRRRGGHVDHGLKRSASASSACTSGSSSASTAFSFARTSVRPMRRLLTDLAPAVIGAVGSPGGGFSAQARARRAMGAPVPGTLVASGLATALVVSRRRPRLLRRGAGRTSSSWSATSCRRRFMSAAGRPESSSALRSTPPDVRDRRTGMEPGAANRAGAARRMCAGDRASRARRARAVRGRRGRRSAFSACA